MLLDKLFGRNQPKVNPERARQLSEAISTICGKKPRNLSLYLLALRHSSITAGAPSHEIREHNERLEYLGDAILGAIVAEYLFKKFPYKDEGFLTEIRSRMVNREMLNSISLKLGLNRLIEASSRTSPGSNRSMHGDALEALIGAVFLDRGFEFCKTFVVDRLIAHHYDLEAMVSSESNPKSRVIEWAQKMGRKIRFDITDIHGKDHNREFTAQVFLDGSPIAQGKGLSKKKAEQAAASQALEYLATLEEEN